jgi:hypothetical protein
LGRPRRAARRTAGCSRHGAAARTAPRGSTRESGPGLRTTAQRTRTRPARPTRRPGPRRSAAPARSADARHGLGWVRCQRTVMSVQLSVEPADLVGQERPDRHRPHVATSHGRDLSAAGRQRQSTRNRPSQGLVITSAASASFCCFFHACGARPTASASARSCAGPLGPRRGRRSGCGLARPEFGPPSPSPTRPPPGERGRPRCAKPDGGGTARWLRPAHGSCLRAA